MKCSRLALAAVCVLALLSPVFLFAGGAFADTPVDNCDIIITNPQQGSIVNSSSVQITVEYLWDTNLTDPPSATNVWEVHVICRLYQSFDSTNEGDFPELEFKTNVLSTTGSAAFSVDLSDYPPGNYGVSAFLMGPGYAMNGLTAWANDESSFQYGDQGSRPPPSSDNFIPVPPDNNQPDDSSGSPLPIIGIVAAVAGAAGLLIRNITKKSQNPPVKKSPPVKKPAPSKPTGPPPGKPRPQSNKAIAEAEEKLKKAKKNKERFDKFTKIRNAVSGDDKLSEFVEKVRDDIIGKDGQVNADKLNRLEFLMKNWIARDKLATQMPDYTSSDAFHDTVRQGSKNIFVRLGAGYLSLGYSEMALNPISALSTMREGIMEGKSTLRAVTEGYATASFELALGESGRLLKYAQPLLNDAKDSYKIYKLSQLNKDLSTEISTINQLAGQADDAARYSRDAYMKSTEVIKAGKTAASGMDDAERFALELNNNAEFRKLMAEHPELVPSKVQDVMGIAKQKSFQSAENQAINDVVEQMGKDGLPAGENPLFINHTGTHAQPGNPGWNSLKSDFDHTVNFGSSKYNKLYEQKFNTHLEAQGTSATAIDANVYGAGTSSRGAYTGGAKKFVEHYNQTSGTDIMIRSDKGGLTISRETPQTSTSLLSRMKPEDIKSTTENYQNFFKKDMVKGGSLENQIANGSKTVSREAGQYSNQYADNFLKTGKVSNYKPPDAAKVADLIKKQGYSVDKATQKVGYKGGKEQLLADYKKIMGVQ